AAFRSEPGFLAASGAQSRGHALAEQVGASLDGEGYAAVGRGERGGKLLHPIDPETEDVVGKPDVIGMEGAFEIQHLRRHGGSTALQILVTPDRLGAPGAAE